jgi:hypothetical protein
MNRLFRVVILRWSAGAPLFHSCDQGTALHAFRNLVSCEIQKCGRDVQQARALVLTAQRAIRRGQDKHPKLRVVATVRTGVVFLHMNSGVTDGSNRHASRGRRNERSSQEQRFEQYDKVL